MKLSPLGWASVKDETECKLAACFSVLFLFILQAEEFIQKGKACYVRELFPKENEKNAYYLYGSGFLKFGQFSVEDPMGGVQFTFRSPTSNGLLMFGVDDKSSKLFHAFELVNGRLVYSYNVGHGFTTLQSKDSYDNGEKVTVVKSSSYFGDTFSLKVSSPQGDETMADNAPYHPGKDYKDLMFVNALYVFMGGVEDKKLLRDCNM